MSRGFSKITSAKCISDVGASSVYKVKEGGGWNSVFRCVFAMTGGRCEGGFKFSTKVSEQTLVIKNSGDNLGATYTPWLEGSIEFF